MIRTGFVDSQRPTEFLSNRTGFVDSQRPKLRECVMREWRINKKTRGLVSPAHSYTPST
jgi:hypothetical protein